MASCRLVPLTLALALLPACLAPLAAVAADLTAQEQRWLRGAWPVIVQARAAQLPVDVVVQPQAAPGLPPLAMAFINGRCKLVFSMRANPGAQAQVDRISTGLGPGDGPLDAALAFMAAHELFGHCARHVTGQWNGVPDGHVDALPSGLGGEVRVRMAEMRAVRREEGYADLAALRWARQHQPTLFPRLHAWLIGERSRDLLPGSHHDTMAWIGHQQAGAGDIEAAWRAVLQVESTPVGQERRTSADQP